VDYELIGTNLSFTSGVLTGDVTVRIYNDNYVEGTETIQLGYSLNANGGNATQGSINQTATITITDDDLEPANATVSVVLLSENFNAGLGSFTTNNPSGDTPWQVGNEAAAETQAYNIPSSNTTNFAYVNDDDCDCDMSEVNLDFPVLDLSGAASAQVTFDTYFETNTYQGSTESAGLYVSVGQGAYTLIGALVSSGVDGPWVTQQFSLNAYIGQNDVRLRVRYNDGGGWLYGCTVDNVLVTAESGIAVQTAVNSNNTDEAYLGPNGTVHFYDPATGNVMATIVNTSSWDYGCVSLEVDRAGTNPGAEVFNSSASADLLHSKTFSIVPANNNVNGTYDLTLYYKQNEVVAWENATGNARSDAQIIKVANSPINSVSPGNYASFNIGTAAANVGTFNSDVTFTASFNTGFSGFGVGILNTLVTNVEERLSDVRVYPNPNGGEFTVSGLEKGSTYQVFNAQGKLIISEQMTIESQLVKLPTSAAPGSYMLVAEKNGLLGKVLFVVTR
jgi:hypothetical protein